MPDEAERLDRTHARGTGTVGKALEVLDAIAEAGRPVRFSELLADSEHPKATLYRLVQTLLREGMVTLDPETGCYSPGVRLLRLAHSAWAASSLAQVAGPFLDHLSEQQRSTVHLAQLDHGQVLYVDKRNSGAAVEMYSQAGKVGPAYCTGVGKVLLAWLGNDELEAVLPQQSYHRFTPATLTDDDMLRRELKEIRVAGYGFDREEHEDGIVCVAVPVLSPNGRCLGALSVTGTTDKLTLEELESRVPSLQHTAKAIGEETQARGFPGAAKAG